MQKMCVEYFIFVQLGIFWINIFLFKKNLFYFFEIFISLIIMDHQRNQEKLRKYQIRSANVHFVKNLTIYRIIWRLVSFFHQKLPSNQSNDLLSYFLIFLNFINYPSKTNTTNPNFGT